jgi:hypothetical protein
MVNTEPPPGMSWRRFTRCPHSQRPAALVERVDAYLSSAIRVDRLDAEGLIGRIGRQLDLGEVDLVRLCRIAVQVGRSGLAAHLERLLAEAGAASLSFAR